MSSSAPAGIEATLSQLSADAREAGTHFPDLRRDGVTSRELRKLLRALAKLAPTVEHPAEPALRITSPAGKFIVQVKGGRMSFVSWNSGQHAGGTPPVDEIVRLVTGEIVEGEFEADDAPVVATAHAPQRKRTLLIALLVVVFVGLNAFTWVEAGKPPGNFLPTYRLLEPDPASRLLETVAGSYETGSQPGDRRLEITKTGEVRWIKYGANRGAVESRQFTVRAAESRGTLALLTNRNTLITVKGPITVSLFGDTTHARRSEVAETPKNARPS
jgi:hypothetical protein